MRWIPTKLHGVLDYLSVATLLALPHVLDASDRATTLLTVIAIVALAYSLLTRYELGAFKVLPMGAHLTLNFLSGALLCAAPFLLLTDENNVFRTALICMGIFEILASLMTHTSASIEDKNGTRPTRNDVSGLPYNPNARH